MGCIAKQLRKLDNASQAGWPRKWGEWCGTLSICRGDGTDVCWWNHNSIGWHLRDKPGDWAVQLSDLVKTGVWRKMVKLSQRYCQFRQYMRETRHQWVVIQTINYADNSVEVVEQSTLTGETRQRMTVAPGGDVCF